MKLIHCSDLHLDSRMEALPPQKAKERRDELRLSFERMVNFACEKGVNAILISGDMFDTQRVSTSTVSFVSSVMRGAPEINFFYLRGNHDETQSVFSGYDRPENLHLFSEGWKGYDCGDAMIWGAENNERIYDDVPFDKNRCNIVMLHGEVSGETGADKVCVSRLKDCGIDYLALGHFHSFSHERLDEDGIYCYSGCLEGRGFDECGEKGFMLLDAGSDGVKARFMPFAKRRLHDIKVDISGLETVTELRDAMRSAWEETGKKDLNKDLVRFILTGSYTPAAQKDLAFLRHAFADDFYYVKIKDESRLYIEREDYINDVSLKGAFIREVMASDMDDGMKERVILCGLGALRGEEADI